MKPLLTAPEVLALLLGGCLLAFGWWVVRGGH